MRTIRAITAFAVSLATVCAFALSGCSAISGGTPDFEDEACIISNLRIDREEVLPYVKADITNKTDSEDSFIAIVNLNNANGEQIADALLISDPIQPGQTAEAKTLIMSEELIDNESPVLDEICSFEVTTVMPNSEYQDAKTTMSNDPILGIWSISAIKDGDDVEATSGISILFSSDGTCTVAGLGDDIEEGTWAATGDDGLQYWIELLDGKWVWGANIFDTNGEEMLFMLDKDNSDLGMAFTR